MGVEQFLASRRWKKQMNSIRKEFKNQIKYRISQGKECFRAIAEKKDGIILKREISVPQHLAWSIGFLEKK